MKEINDGLGHAAGDQALLATTSVLNATLRDSDIAARFGGDEFVVLAGGCSRADAETVLERMAERVDELNAEGKLPFELVLSMGVAHAHPVRPRALEELLEEADADLYSRRWSRRASTEVPALNEGD